jgi:hypothetical protein
MTPFGSGDQRDFTHTHRSMPRNGVPISSCKVLLCSMNWQRVSAACAMFSKNLAINYIRHPQDHGGALIMVSATMFPATIHLYSVVGTNVIKQHSKNVKKCIFGKLRRSSIVSARV